MKAQRTQRQILNLVDKETTMRLSTLLIAASSTTTTLAFTPAVTVKQHASVTKSSASNAIQMATNGEVNGAAVVTDAPKSDYLTSSELLGRPARPGRPLKVAIAGGGVGGLTAAFVMLKKGFDVTVYEKTAAFARFGGPIQFASNALSVIKEIDENLFERVMDKFTFTGTRICGIKDGLRADGSFRMTDDSLDYLFNADAPADWFVKFPLRQCADLFGLSYTGEIYLFAPV